MAAACVSKLAHLIGNLTYFSDILHNEKIYIYIPSKSTHWQMLLTGRKKLY